MKLDNFNNIDNFDKTLYIISTPIGNLEDITLRALRMLKMADIIICEDSRVTLKLLNHFDIKNKKLFVYNDSSNHINRNKLLELINNNQNKTIALVSDAGTPLISDPGYKLIDELSKSKDSNIKIDVIPGCCSVIAALTVSAMPTDKFYFAGFTPKGKNKKIDFFNEIKNFTSTIILFESPMRLLESLFLIKEIFGSKRQIAVARELTKLYQDVNKGNIDELIDYYQNKPIKGEIILLIEGYNIKNDETNYLALIESEIKDLVKTTNKTAKDITNQLTAKYKGKINKSVIYNIVNKEKTLLKK